MGDGAEGGLRGRSEAARATLLERRVIRLGDALVAGSPAVLRDLLRRPLADAGRGSGGSAPLLARMMACLGLVLGVVLLVTQVGQELVLGDPVPMFDADAEHNFWAWTHVVALMSATLVVALLAEVTRSRALGFASVTLLFLSADEFLEIHGRIADTLVFFPHAGRLIWPALYLPLLAALLIVLWRAVVPHPDTVRAMVRGGLLLLVAAVVLELASVGIFLVADGFGLLYNLEVALEEGAEVAGWLLVAGGVTSVVVPRGDVTPTAPADPGSSGED